ncbi:899_t:CDS:2, partial [Racocetra fulgida]
SELLKIDDGNDAISSDSRITSNNQIKIDKFHLVVYISNLIKLEDMYTQPPPPNSQQATQRPSTSPTQPQQRPMGPNVGVSTSQAQQNFSGYRPVGPNTQSIRPPPQVVAGIPPNARPTHVTGGRPPTNFATQGFPGSPAQGIRPTMPAQQGPTIGIPPGQRPPTAPPQVGPGYQQTPSQYAPRPPPGNEGIDSILPNISNVRISQDPPIQNQSSQIDQQTRSPKQNRSKRAHHDLGPQPHSSVPSTPSYHQPPTNNAPQTGQAPTQPMYTSMVSQPTSAGQGINQPQYTQPPQLPVPQQPPAS